MENTYVFMPFMLHKSDNTDYHEFFKKYSDSTLKGMKKAELIEYIRELEEYLGLMFNSFSEMADYAFCLESKCDDFGLEIKNYDDYDVELKYTENNYDFSFDNTYIVEWSK